MNLNFCVLSVLKFLMKNENERNFKYYQYVKIFLYLRTVCLTKTLQTA